MTRKGARSKSMSKASQGVLDGRMTAVIGAWSSPLYSRLSCGRENPHETPDSARRRGGGGVLVEAVVRKLFVDPAIPGHAGCGSRPGVTGGDRQRETGLRGELRPVSRYGR